MATLFDDASLVMLPSGYKDDKLYSIKPTDGSGDFTFSRDGSGASPATRVNSAGLIEKGRTNLLLQSNTFDTTWALTSASVTSGQSGYDGTNNAWELLSTGASCRASQTISTTGVQTMSVYAKAGSVDWMAFYVVSTSPPYVYFDLANGVLGGVQNNVIDAGIDNVGNGWYRCYISFNKTATEVRIFTATGNGLLTTASGDSIYIQNAQLEKGLVATNYIATTTAAASAGILGDMPRLDYSGGATCPSLLLEPARTNLFTNSEYFGDWLSNRLDATANDATSPEGVQNAYKVAQQSGFTTAPNVNKGSIAAGTYSISIFAKKGTWSYLAISFQGVSYFNLDSGTKGTINGNHTANIEDYGNGWYKCTITRTTTTTQTPAFYFAENDNTLTTSDTQGYMYIYGAQIEAGSYPTSYIPTHGSATARAVDNCSKTGISSLIGQTEGTLFIDFIRPANALIANQVIYGITDTGSQNRLRILTTGSDAVRVLFQTNGNQIEYDVNLSFTLTPDNTPIKLAVGYKSGDIACYVNGNQADTSSNSITITTSIENIEINSTPNSNIVSQALLFDTRLTNAELAALTT